MVAILLVKPIRQNYYIYTHFETFQGYALSISGLNRQFSSESTRGGGVVP